LEIDEKAILEKALQDINPWMWPFELQRTHDESDKLAASYNDSGLGDAVKAEVDKFNETAKQPVNAEIAYSESLGAYTVVPEELGTALDYDAVLNVVDEAIIAMGPTATVTKQALLKPPVLSTDATLRKACDSANTMIKADLELMMGPSSAAKVGPDQISSWITFDESHTATLDEGLMTAWIDELAAACNTLGSSRTYTRPDGKVVTVSGGTYGWVVDHEALMTLVKEGVAAGSKGQFDIPVSQTAGQFAGAGGRDWGNSYVDIDLAEQYARYYDDSGIIIWESAIVSGTPDGIHNTPAGVYMLNSKASPSKLIGWENGKKIYETDVSYWMPFIGNAIGLHDATWQSAFGGSRYAEGFGSHGCVNLPFSEAQALYNMLPIGVPVISHW
ncbi:MAG: L,D-transpeptidase family protein, partial [Raoultibacter sp.]